MLFSEAKLFEVIKLYHDASLGPANQKYEDVALAKVYVIYSIYYFIIDIYYFMYSYIY